MSHVRLGVVAATAVIVAFTLPVGGRAFDGAVLLWAAVLLVEVGGLLAQGAARPLLPAAAVGALGAPLWAGAAPAWERMPLLLAAALLAAFVVALVSPRTTDITIVVGVTVLPALLIGLGGAGLLVLRSASAGFRWTLGTLLLTAVPTGLAALAGRVAGPGVQTPAHVVSAGAMGGALLLAVNPPFGAVMTLLLTGVGLGAGWMASAWLAALGSTDRPALGPGYHAGLAVLTAPLIAAPVAAFLALSTQA